MIGGGGWRAGQKSAHLTKLRDCTVLYNTYICMYILASMYATRSVICFLTSLPALKLLKMSKRSHSFP